METNAMAVNNEQVIALYTEKKLTMQQIADRLGITKARVHQILRQAGVKTGYRNRPARAGKDKSGKAYRAYRFAPETRELIERLAAKMGISRTAAVIKAVEEMATRELDGSPRDGEANVKKRRGRRVDE
jgi:hypothetical protein